MGGSWTKFVMPQGAYQTLNVSFTLDWITFPIGAAPPGITKFSLSDLLVGSSPLQQYFRSLLVQQASGCNPMIVCMNLSSLLTTSSSSLQTGIPSVNHNLRPSDVL